MKASSTLVPILADVSMKLQPRRVARDWPSTRAPSDPLENDENFARTVHAHLAFVLQIAFGRHNEDTREPIHALNLQNLLVESADLLKRSLGRDRVHEEEAFTGTHVLLAHGTV